MSATTVSEQSKPSRKGSPKKLRMPPASTPANVSGKAQQLNKASFDFPEKVTVSSMVSENSDDTVDLDYVEDAKIKCKASQKIKPLSPPCSVLEEANC